MSAITYKGHYATIEFDPEDMILTGRLAGIDDIVTFHAESGAGIVKAFREAVDSYLRTCKRLGKDPERPYSGRLFVRVDPSLHAQVVRAAELSGMSFNEWGGEVLRRAALDVHENAVSV
ncbi:MAG TPA: type II toxin-antitoxin system HicB family antitoxin [Sphingomonas sp.]|nr:type II toxin-antitoxin system HicB family antitoxin [Sphingomonas sp.]